MCAYVDQCNSLIQRLFEKVNEFLIQKLRVELAYAKNALLWRYLRAEGIADNTKLGLCILPGLLQSGRHSNVDLTGVRRCLLVIT